MEFELDKGQATHKIQSYSQGFVIINQIEYRNPIVVMPEKIINPWGPTSFESLTPEHFQMLLPYKPQVVLVGTGPSFRLMDPSLYAGFINLQIGVEVMDTGAACRTYQVLMSEGREVMAALLL